MDFKGSFGPFGEKNVIWPVAVSSVKSKSHPVVEEKGKKYEKIHSNLCIFLNHFNVLPFINVFLRQID